MRIVRQVRLGLQPHGRSEPTGLGGGKQRQRHRATVALHFMSSKHVDAIFFNLFFH